MTPGDVKSEKNGTPRCQKCAHWNQKGAKREPKGAKRDPKGSQEWAKGGQRKPKVSQRATKMHPKIDIRKKTPKRSEKGAVEH